MNSYVKTMISHHETFRKEAAKAGKSVEDYAEEHSKASGTRGHQARMHQSLNHLMKQPSKHKPPHGALASNAHDEHGNRYNG